MSTDQTVLALPNDTLAADNARWQQCWRDKTTAFHLPQVNPFLPRCWPMLTLTAGCTVLVPLCGKSLDLKWLLDQGHRVIGVELSPLAVRAYFREHKLQPVREVQGEFVRWSHGSLSILCGDFFKLTAAQIPGVQAVYDCAALTALPETLRQRYADHLFQLLPAGFVMLLLTIEEAESLDEEITPLSPELEALYGAQLNIRLAALESQQEQLEANQPPVRVDYKGYALHSKLPVS